MALRLWLGLVAAEELLVEDTGAVCTLRTATRQGIRCVRPGHATHGWQGSRQQGSGCPHFKMT